MNEPSVFGATEQTLPKTSLHSTYSDSGIFKENV
jgi:hypothetical protein